MQIMCLRGNYKLKNRFAVTIFSIIIVIFIALIIFVLVYRNIHKSSEAKTPYELAVENGYSGTENEWLAALVGEFGENGKTAYDIAVEKGYKADYDTWIKDLNK